MKILRFSIVVLLLVAGALMVAGSPGSAEQEKAPEAAASAAGGVPESASGESPQAEERPEGESGGQPLETFIPTERLPADSAISFPVDI